jgi:SAM-dependent methyltransferase
MRTQESLPASIKAFERYYIQCDRWFSKNEWIYRSEIEAIKKFMPHNGLGLEVGVGSGRFSSPFKIQLGLDPSRNMCMLAKKRGIKVICGVGECLPFRNSIFDFVLIVTTICFVNDPFLTIKECRRVLKKCGLLIIGLIDKNSWLGKTYENIKENIFYKHANFYSVDDVREWLELLSFNDFSIYQTIFRNLNEIDAVEPIKEGYGEGGFVVFKVRNIN